MAPVDIVMLTYNRLDHLASTVDALEARTPEPFRLTIVDNASASDVRNWLVENRERFHDLILQPENEHIAGFQRGIDATTSDPFVLMEPDLIVPDVQPSWLARLGQVLDDHPDFGLVALGIDPANRPTVLGPESIDKEAVVDADLVEGNVGIWCQMIRRDALRVPYVKDSAACAAVREAGYRVGWVTQLRAFHLGWDDYRLHPSHLASKNELPSPYPYYREVDLIGRPPAVEELARAAPIVAELRRAGVDDAGVLELAWAEPVVGAALEDVTTLVQPALPLPIPDRSVGAVVLVEPSGGLAERALAEAARLAARVVVGIAPLSLFGGRAAADVAPAGWLGTERPWLGALPLELARQADRLPEMATHRRYTTLEDRDEWLSFFAQGTIPPETGLRLFVFTACDPAATPGTPPELRQLSRWRPRPRPIPSDEEPPVRWRVKHALATRAPQSVRAAVRKLRRRGG